MKKSLAIAFETQKHSKPKKKMAEGGSIKEESRPMPDDKHNDSKMISQNEDKKSIKDNNFSKSVHAAKVPLSAPRMAESSIIKAKLIKDIRDEDMKKMAEGGEASDVEKRRKSMTDTFGDQSGKKSLSDQFGDWVESKMAEGGEISPQNEIDEEHHDSISAAIMARRERMHDMIDSGSLDEDHAVKMADGGEVDLEANSEESANTEDQLSFDAIKKEQYDLSQLDEQPEDSNETGDEREKDSENKMDRISAIRSRMKKGQFK